MLIVSFIGCTVVLRYSLDNNNRKPICRLHLNGNKKAITVFDENRVEHGMK